MKKFGHNREKLIIEVKVELVVELFIRGFSQGLDDVVNALSEQILDFVVIIWVAVGCVNIGHQVDEEMRNLIYKFERFVVFENNLLLFLFLFFFFVSFFVGLTSVHFVLRIFSMFT